MRGISSIAVVALAAMTSACGSDSAFRPVPGVCAGPALEAPHVAVNTAAWSALHPDASVQACLDSACQPVTAQSGAADGVHLYPAAQSVDEPLTVSVRATQNAVTLLDTATTVRLEHLHLGEGGPCGDFSQWRAQVTLDPSGQLHTVHTPHQATATATATTG